MTFFGIKLDSETFWLAIGALAPIYFYFSDRAEKLHQKTTQEFHQRMEASLKETNLYIRKIDEDVVSLKISNAEQDVKISSLGEKINILLPQKSKRLKSGH